MEKQRTSENSLNKLAEIYEQVIVDEASTTVSYIGYTESGVATSAAKWIIVKIESASATTPTGVTTIKYATSYKSRTNIWDNRAALTYTT